MIGAMLAEAWAAMGANRLRTFLTMLGMVIGVGAVILMMAVGQGAQQQVQASIASMGSNLFILLSGSTSAGGVRSGSGGNLTLTVADAEAIGFNIIKLIDGVVGMRRRRGLIRLGGRRAWRPFS